MTKTKRFPVLIQGSEMNAYPDCPRSIPWDLVEPYRDQAMRNHDQTLEELARRGGLCPQELFMITYGIKWGRDREPSLPVAMQWLDSVSDKPQGERK